MATLGGGSGRPGPSAERRSGAGAEARFSLPAAVAPLTLLLMPAFPSPCRDYVALDGRLHFLDCAERFLVPGGGAINADLMRDALHPNAAGAPPLVLWSTCPLAGLP